MKQQAMAGGLARGGVGSKARKRKRAGKASPAAPAPVPQVRQERVAGMLVPFRQHSRVVALAIFLADLALYVGSLVGFFLAPSLGWRLVAGAVNGLAIALLFIVGHDCGHLSFSGSPRLDKVLGRLAMLPSLHSFSQWVRTHNRLHHAFTNLKSYDCVFAPLSKAEYDRLPGWRRLLERVYRHWSGIGVYYALELWLRRFFMPQRGQRLTVAAVLDSVLVVAYAGALLGGLAWAAQATGVPPWQAVVGLFVLPLVVWMHLMAFALYNNHTHERVRWFARREEWSFFQAQVGSTIHMAWPRPLDVLFHTLMQHTAHHVDPHVPVYRLARAQAFLEQRYAQVVPVVQLTWTSYFTTARRCKLYDYERHCWTDFEGRPTS